MAYYHSVLYELALLSFSLAFFFLGVLCVLVVIWVGVMLYRWAAGGGLAHLTKGLLVVDNRSGVIAPTEADSWRIDKELEREEEKMRRR